MNGKFTKANIHEILRGFGLDGNQARQATIQIIKALASALADGEPVELRGLGCMHVKERKPYKARNPRTGESVITQPCGRVLFRPGRQLKKSLLLVTE